MFDRKSDHCGGIEMTEDMFMNEKLLYFNGINGANGAYALPPQDPETFSKLIAGAPVDKDELTALSNWYAQISQPNWALIEGHDPDKLEEAGWGIVYPHGVDLAIKDALAPLVEWRKAQAAASKEHYFKELTYRPGENKNAWLVRNGYAPGPANPEKIPYYLLLVGSPEQIPYNFQTSLDVQYGVGRICFDSVVEYANYAQSVVEAEKQQLKLARQVSFFGVANDDDKATILSANHLIAPLLQGMMDDPKMSKAGWNYSAILKDEATKNRLGELLGGAQTPALLFTASHGMGFPNGHQLQERHQGALLCQDWPGPRAWRTAVPDNFYFSAEDLASDANLWGSIAFLFACYGAGTPKFDEFAHKAMNQRGEIARESFIARLPQRMLSHPKGGSLAVVGHVERAWSYSFVWGRAGQTLEVFQTAFKRLMQGSPIGYAFEQFNERYAELSTDLTVSLEDAKFGTADALDLSGLWTANNDAKNYVVLGDPAVRMMVAPQSGAQAAAPARPVITLTRVPSFKPVKAFDVSGETAAEQAANGGSGESETTGGEIIHLPSETPPAGESFGLPQDVSGALAGFFNRLGLYLGDAITNAATLEVRTFTSDNIQGVKMPKKGEMVGAKLRALTYIHIDGDVDQVVPVNEDGSVDYELFQVHLDMLKQAEANRTEMLRSLLEVAANFRGIK
jgi:hypothetical protein